MVGRLALCAAALVACSKADSVRFGERVEPSGTFRATADMKLEIRDGDEVLEAWALSLACGVEPLDGGRAAVHIDALSVKNDEGESQLSDVEVQVDKSAGIVSRSDGEPVRPEHAQLILATVGKPELRAVRRALLEGKAIEVGVWRAVPVEVLALGTLSDQGYDRARHRVERRDRGVEWTLETSGDVGSASRRVALIPETLRACRSEVAVDRRTNFQGRPARVQVKSRFGISGPGCPAETN